MQIINCFIQIFMGAVSGYYTNKLAISHLFTDIPLLGGTSWKAVIKKGGNKERLAEDLSEIAEDNIIGKRLEQEDGNDKKSYLYQELSKKDVLNTLDQCVEDIFRELQESKAGQRTLSEIFENFLKDDYGQYQIMEKSLETAAADWRIGDFITEETFCAFCEELWRKKLYPKLQKEDGLEAVLEGLFGELSESYPPVTLETILGQEICGQAEEVFVDKIMELNSIERDSDRMKMEGYLHSVCRQLGIGTIVRNIFILLREKKIEELFFLPDEKWFSEKLIFILEQPEIRKNLQRLFEIFMAELAQSDLTLSDFLPEGCLESEKIIEILTEQIRKLQPFVSDLYDDNRDFISGRLMKELSTVIEEGTGNFLQNMVLLTARDTILEKMQEFLREKMPEKIQEFFESPSREICLELCRISGQISVSELTDKISFDTVFLSLKRELQNDSTLSKYLLEKIKNIPLSFLFNDDIVDYLSKKMDTLLLDMVSEWLKGKEAGKNFQESFCYIKKAIHALVEKLSKKPLKKQEVERLLKEIKKRSLPEKLSAWINGLVLPEKKDQKTESGEKENRTVFAWIYGKFSDIFIKDLWEEGLFANTEEIPGGQTAGNGNEKKVEKLSCILLENVIRKYGDELTLGTIISAVPKESVKKKVRELFTENAGNYLSVKPMVKEKVLALDEDTLCQMMQKFMGTQLKPLNRIGGALGAVVGLLVWVVNPSMEMSLPMVVCAAVCYAMIGIGTNVLALHGLFRPYHIKERKWLGRFAQKDGAVAKTVMAIYHFLSKIPGIRNVFCLGYIPEKKDRIAGQLANFVADNFLKPEELLPEIKLKPEMVQKFLNDHGDIIAEHAVEKLQQADWEQAIKRFVLTTNRKGNVDGNFEETVRHKIKETIKNMDISFLSEMVYPALEEIQTKPLKNYIHSEQAAEKITAFLQFQIKNADGKQKEFMKVLRKWYEKTLQEKTAKELLSEKQEIIAQKITQVFSRFFYGEELLKQVEHFVFRALSARMAERDRCITSFFGGRMGKMLDENLDSLERALFHMLKKQCYHYLLNHEEDLVDKLDLEIQDMINDMADGMPLGGLASSMLGTKQLIGKVFHRVFIEPQFQEIQSQENPFGKEWNDEKSCETEDDEFHKTQNVMQERLSDELFDRNEERLLGKLDEILKTQGAVLTLGDLEEVLFASDSTEEKREKEEQWIQHLCATGSAILNRSRTKSMEPIQNITEHILSVAGTHTIGEYTCFVNDVFLERVMEEEIFGEIRKVMQKPSMEQACTDCFRYLLDSWLLLDDWGRYLSVITKGSLAAILQNNWKSWSSLSCVDVFLSELLALDYMDLAEDLSSSISALVKELADSLKEKDSVEEGCRKFLVGSLEILSGFFHMEEQKVERKSFQPCLCQRQAQTVSDLWHDTKNEIDGSVQNIIQEILICVNEAFQYKKENQTTLVSVAQQVDFANIIYLAVMDMTDAQIEELFKGFAGSYFLSLKLSGTLGFVFGVPVVQWVAAIAAVGSEFVRKNKTD